MELAVEIAELSRFIDNELSPEELQDVSKRLAGCVTSRKVLERLREAMTEIGQAILESAPPRENFTTPDCLDDDTLSRLADGILPPPDAKRAETHAAACQHCLRKILESVRAAVAVDAANWRELPPEIRNDERLGPLRDIRPKPRKLEYAKVRRETVVCPLKTQRAVIQQFVTDEGYGVKISLMPQAGNLIAIEIMVTFDKQPRGQEEIIVNVADTTTQIFRGTTSRDGRVLVRRLKEGDYDIFLSAANLLVTAQLVAN